MNKIEKDYNKDITCTHCKKAIDSIYRSNFFEREGETLCYIICSCANVMEAVIEDDVIIEVRETPEKYTEETARKIRHAFELFEEEDGLIFDAFSVKGNVLIDMNDMDSNLLVSTAKNKMKGNTVKNRRKKGEMPSEEDMDRIYREYYEQEGSEFDDEEDEE